MWSYAAGSSKKGQQQGDVDAALMPEGDTVLNEGGVGVQSACDGRDERIVPEAERKIFSFAPSGNKMLADMLSALKLTNVIRLSERAVGNQSAQDTFNFPVTVARLDQRRISSPALAREQDPTVPMFPLAS